MSAKNDKTFTLAEMNAAYRKMVEGGELTEKERLLAEAKAMAAGFPSVKKLNDEWPDVVDSRQTFLTTGALAKRWQISANTLRNWRFRGVGPRYFKPSGDRGKALYRLEDVQAWEEKNTIGGEA